jgi:hypothetical protein
VNATNNQYIIATGLAGLAAAVITGAGEFLLHYDPQARFGEGLNYLLGISEQRTNIGHFLGVIGAPLYAVGAFHIFQMLKPANRRWAFILFMTMAYGCAMGGVWISSRASISALINAPQYSELSHLVELYNLRYETLLNIMRVVILTVSAIYIWLVLTGRSLYPKWMAFFNPILLIVMSFVFYLTLPTIGKYIMPIALNVAFFIFYSLSIWIACKQRGVQL